MSALARIAKRRGPDLLALALVGAASFLGASSEVRSARDRGEKPYFYQPYYEPAIRLACGQPFGIDREADLSPEMQAFLRGERDALDCEYVAPARGHDPDPSTKIWYHTFAATGALWRVTGISWSVMEAAAAFFVSLTAVFVYGLFRLWMPIPVAAVLALLSVWPAMRYVLYQRDLSKAPFILGALFVGGLLVSRRLSRPAVWAVMTSAGLWLGMGYGFRPDALIVLPLLVVAAIGFRCQAPRRAWVDGVIGTALMIVAFRVAAAPAVPAERTNVGSCHWHFALLGLSDGHTQTLGLDPGTVSWISHYSDVLVWRSVETYAQRTSGPSEVGFCTADYDRASFRMYFEVLRTFPRDLALRGLAAARHLVDYGLWSLPVVDGGNPLGERLLRNRTTVRTLWLLMWLPLLIVLLAREVRVGLFAILAFAYLCAYPAVQFDPRHFFQLAFLTWVPIGILTALVWRTGARAVAVARSPGRIDWIGTLGLPPAAAWRRAMTILAGGAISLAGAFALASWMQRAAVDRLLEGYLRAAGVVAPVAIREDVDGRVRIGFGGFAPESDRRFGARAMRLVLGGRSCPVGIRTITAGVTGSVVAGPVIRKDHAVRMEPGREVALFLPFYYERAQADRAYVELAAEDVACVLRAEWVDSQQLPSLWGATAIETDARRPKLPGAEPSG